MNNPEKPDFTPHQQEVMCVAQKMNFPIAINWDLLQVIGLTLEKATSPLSGREILGELMAQGYPPLDGSLHMGLLHQAGFIDVRRVGATQ